MNLKRFRAKPYSKKFAKASLFFATLSSQMCLALADDTIAGVGAQVNNVLKDVYDVIAVVITAVAAVMIGGLLLVRMFSNQQGAQQATAWIKRVIACYALFFCLGTVFKVVRKITAGNEFSDTTITELQNSSSSTETESTTGG